MSSLLRLFAIGPLSQPQFPRLGCGGGWGGWRWYPGCDRAGRARLLTVSGPRGCGEAGARAAPGTRCGGAALAAPAARTLGLAHTWWAAAGAVPGALRPQAGVAGIGPWSQLKEGVPQKPASHCACYPRAGGPPAPSFFAKSCISCFKAESPQGSSVGEGKREAGCSFETLIVLWGCLSSTRPAQGSH